MKKMYVASITPFDQKNQLNEQALKQLWDRNLAEGADGFFIGGSSGEKGEGAWNQPGCGCTAFLLWIFRKRNRRILL